jgi:hypothetical protein
MNLCPHCGGGGKLRYDNRRTEGRLEYQRVGPWFPCNFCNGTGDGDYPPPPWPPADLDNYDRARDERHEAELERREG